MDESPTVMRLSICACHGYKAIKCSYSRLKWFVIWSMMGSIFANMLDSFATIARYFWSAEQPIASPLHTFAWICLPVSLLTFLLRRVLTSYSATDLQMSCVGIASISLFQFVLVASTPTVLYCLSIWYVRLNESSKLGRNKRCHKFSGRRENDN